MEHIRLTLHLPNQAGKTIYVEDKEMIIDWIVMVLYENTLKDAPADYKLLRNNQKEISPFTNFLDAGFTNGDELYIYDRNNAPANDLQGIGEVKEGRTFHQLGILLLDGSGSMSEQDSKGSVLAESVNMSVREFFGFFKNSSQVENFSIAVVTFDHTARVHTAITELSSVNDYADYNPLHGHGGGTYIGGALVEAEKLATEFLSSPEALDVPTDVRIIVLSDGLCLEPAETKAVADRIKQNSKILICSTLFMDSKKSGSDELQEAKTVLAEIVSAPRLYKTTYKEKDLRTFFIESMSTKRRYGGTV